MAATKSISDLIAQAAGTLPDNTTQDISPQDVREMAENLAQSNFNKITDDALVGLKEHSTAVVYPSGQGATYLGDIYISNQTTGPGAFTPAHWDKFTQAELTPQLLGGANVTGILTGGEVTVNGGDNTKVDIAAGTGLIINWTDPANPVRTNVVWGAKTAVTLPDVSKAFTVLGIDAAGDVVFGGAAYNESEVRFTPAQKRVNIQLQTVGHTTGVVTPGEISSSSRPAYEVLAALLDYVDQLGGVNTGNLYSVNGANTRLDKAAGTTSEPFINRANDVTQPVTKVNPAQTAGFFSGTYQDATPGDFVIEAPTQDINTTLWDDGSGTLQTMSNNKWQVKRLYFFGINEVNSFTYGQAEYNSKDEAKVAIFTEAPEVSPIYSDAVFVMALIHEKGDTDFSAGNAELVKIEGFGTSGVAGGGDNVANANLVSDGVYTFDINGNDWKIVNGVNTVLDLQSSGRVGYAGDFLSTAAHCFSNPLNLVTIAEFQHQNGVESVLINTNGALQTYNTSGTLIHRLRNQSGVGYLEGWNSSGVQYMSFQSGENGYYAKRININAAAAAHAKAVLQLNQTNANVSQQIFFANITTTTAGRAGSSVAFGASEKGFEVFDTDLDRKHIWNGIDFSRIATYDEILSNSWISATETILEASLASLTAYTYDVIVAGVSVGDACIAIMDEDVQAAITTANAQDHTRAYCAVAGTVRVILMVSSFITVPASSVFKVRVFK